MSATPENQEEVSAPDVQRAGTETVAPAEKTELLDGFNLDVLVSAEKSAYVNARSSDIELGKPDPHVFSWREEEKSAHIPEVFRGKRETEFLFELIRKPLTDIRQICQRQALVEALVAAPDFAEIAQLKDGCFKFGDGVKRLFADIAVGQYHSEPALRLYREGKMDGGARTCVEEGLAFIEEGKKSIARMAGILKGSASPFMRALAADVTKLGNQLQKFNRRYFLNEDYQKVGQSSRHAQHVAEKKTTHIGAFVEFVKLARQDEYAQCTFDPGRPYEHKQGWNFFRTKEARGANHNISGDTGHPAQVKNDSPRHTPVTIYNGSNMSGKSFTMKKDWYMQFVAQAFGYAPCAEGNFGVYDSFHYLDRASTKAYINLSAFGAEVQDWKEEIPKFGSRPFICCDEGWSTTSPEDQYLMLSATDLYLRNRNARIFYASHNEEFVERHCGDQNVGIYHLALDIDGKGKVTYKYELKEGPDDSRALQVGRALGLPEEWLSLAEGYLQRKFPAFDSVPRKGRKAIETYSEEARAALKKAAVSPHDLIGSNRENGLIHILSEDMEFQRTWGHIINVEGTYERPYASNALIRGMENLRKEALAKFLLNTQRREPKDVLEIRRTFDALTANDRFPELLDIEHDLVYLIRFLPYALTADLLRFNHAISPFMEYSGRGASCDYHHLELFIKYLEFNQKLLGEKFPLAAELAQLKALGKLFDTVGKITRDRSLDEILAAQEADVNEVVTDPEALALFAEFVKPEDRAILEGPLTRSVIEKHIEETERADFALYRNEKFQRLKRIFAAANRVYYETFERFRDRKKEMVAAFEKLVGILGEENPEQYNGRITIRRLMALQDRLDARLQVRGSFKNDDESYCIHKLPEFIREMQLAQKDLALNEGGLRITPNSVSEAITHNMRKMLADLKKIPDVAIFDCDIESLRGHLQPIWEYWTYVADKDRERDGDYSDTEFNFAIGLKFLAEKGEVIRRYLEVLRSYDSVHCHQMANALENALGRVLYVGKESGRMFDLDDGDECADSASIGKWRWPRERETFAAVCSEEQLAKIDRDLDAGRVDSYLALKKEFSLATPGFALNAARKLYENANFQAAYRELCELKTERAALFEVLPANMRDGYGTEEMFKFAGIYRRVVAGQNISREEGVAFVCDFANRAQVNLDTQNVCEWTGRMNRECVGDVSREFAEKYVTGSQFLERISGAVQRLENLGRKADGFCQRHRIEIKTEDGYGYGRRDEAAHQRIRRGDLYYLKKHVDHLYNKSVHKTLQVFERFRAQEERGILYSALAKASVFFRAAHIIGRHGHARVGFNDKGVVDLQGAWNLFADRQTQVRNDFQFGEDELLKIFGSPNMSGKTFGLKTLFNAMSWIFATGYAPAKYASVPIVDGCVYIDRVTSKSDRNLSAYGNEVEFWKMVHKIAVDGNLLVIGSWDEIFSTTSPRYQEALAYALAVSNHMIYGNKGALASHNHRAIDALLRQYPAQMQGHHFSWKEEERDGQRIIVPEFKLTPGNRKSHALDVARTLGLQPEIIRFGEMIRASAESAIV